MNDYDYSKLNGKIREANYTQKTLGDAIGLSETSVNLSLNNKRDFRQDEIWKICDVLKIQAEDIPSYFFAH